MPLAPTTTVNGVVFNNCEWIVEMLETEMPDPSAHRHHHSAFWLSSCRPERRPDPVHRPLDTAFPATLSTMEEG